MSQEILYTSAPEGLKPGSRGFCTVVSTAGMASNLAEKLESLSGYRHAFAPHGPEAPLNPVNYSHLILSVGGQRYHVLSRIADAGQDYTGRSNKLVHHVALAESEIVASDPAAVLAEPGFCVTKWDGQTRILPAGRVPSGRSPGPAPCQAWHAAAGDAGWAGYVAEQLLRGGKPVSVIFRPGTDTLPLIMEVFGVLPADRRWDITFSSYFTKLPPEVDCQLRFVLDGTAEAKALRRRPHETLFDLAKPLGAAPDGPLTDAARSGKREIPRRAKAGIFRSAGVQLSVEDTTNESDSPHARSQATAEDATYQPQRPARPRGGPTAPPPPPSARAKQGSASSRTSSGRRGWRVLKITAFVLWSLLLLGIGLAGGYLVWGRSSVAPPVASSKQPSAVVSPSDSTTPAQMVVDRSRALSAVAPDSQPSHVAAEDLANGQPLDADSGSSNPQTGQREFPSASGTEGDPESPVVQKRDAGKQQLGPNASTPVRIDADMTPVPPLPELRTLVPTELEIPSRSTSDQRRIQLIQAFGAPKDVELELVGVSAFSVKEPSSRAAPLVAWTVSRSIPNAPPGSDSSPIATFFVDSQGLHFEWDSEARTRTDSDLLRFCRLKIQTAGGRAETQLRRVTDGESMKLSGDALNVEFREIAQELATFEERERRFIESHIRLQLQLEKADLWEKGGRLVLDHSEGQEFGAVAVFHVEENLEGHNQPQLLLKFRLTPALKCSATWFVRLPIASYYGGKITFKRTEDLSLNQVDRRCKELRDQVLDDLKGIGQQLAKASQTGNQQSAGKQTEQLHEAEKKLSVYKDGYERWQVALGKTKKAVSVNEVEYRLFFESDHGYEVELARTSAFRSDPQQKSDPD